MNDPMEALFEFPGMNDPMGVILPKDLLSQFTSVLEDTANTARTSGVISMSETHLNYPMWAYYGSNFAGMCLEFDTQELTISDLPRDSYFPVPVKYNSIAPRPITLEHLAISDPMDVVTRRLIQKRAEWAHEKEWRYLAGRPGPKRYTDPALKRIYLGPNIDPHVKTTIVDAMKRRPVEIYEGLVVGYEVKFSCIQQSIPWAECDRTGAGIFNAGVAFKAKDELRSILGNKFEVLEQKCLELAAHPNVETVAGAHPLKDGKGVYVNAIYRLRDDAGDIVHSHVFDRNMNPLKFS